MINIEMEKAAGKTVRTAEHLFEIYPHMPRYANDPQESEVVRIYDFILRRFQGFYSKQPALFVKAGTSPILFGDQHQYSAYPYLSFSSSQDIIVAIAKTNAQHIRINNYQSALYGEQTLSSRAEDWKFGDCKEGDRFAVPFTKILALVAEDASLRDLGGMDILIYTGLVEDQFVGWKESLFACFYAAVLAVITKNKPIEGKAIFNLLEQLKTMQPDIQEQPQLLQYKAGHFTQHRGPQPRQIPLPHNLSLVMAHSLTPLPKKLIQGKRFNLRRCEVLIALEYLKSAAGTTKDFGSLRELQEFIGCTTEELIKEVEETLPSGKVSSQQVEAFADCSLIDILKEVPYANSVIDQNKEFFPKDRALFFLKEALLLERLTPENLIDSLRESYRNQVDLLGLGSEQIDHLLQVAEPWVLGHKIVGNGWGGNVLLVCEKSKASGLVQELMNQFYLAQENKVLLSDDLQQYVQVVGSPNTGLALLDPTSQIWY